LMKNDPQKAIQYVHQRISDLLLGKVDMSQLIISRGLSKTKEHYAESTAKQAHAELAKRIEKRSATTGETVPHTGDRVKYVIRDGSKKDKTSELAEDPLYVMKHNIPINTTYYIEKQMMKPLCKIFTPVLAPNEMTFKYNKKGERVDLRDNEWKALTAYKKLFTGEHTQHIFLPPTMDYGIGKFLNKTSHRRCYKCSTRIDATKLLCPRCEPTHNQSARIELTQKVQIAEQRYNAAWTRCQRCVGNLHSPVLCENMDCDNFFHRQATIVDLEDIYKQIKLN